MRRLILASFLAAGVFVGYGSGFAHLAQHAGTCHDRAPAATPGPALDAPLGTTE